MEFRYRRLKSGWEAARQVAGVVSPVCRPCAPRNRNGPGGQMDQQWDDAMTIALNLAAN